MSTPDFQFADQYPDTAAATGDADKATTYASGWSEGFDSLETNDRRFVVASGWTET